MRYAFNNDIDVHSTLSTDVLIVGAGIAGLYTALHIAQEKSVLVLSKESIEISNSYLAQGGCRSHIAGRSDHPSMWRIPWWPEPDSR